MDKIIVVSLIRRWDKNVPPCIRSVLAQTHQNWIFYILASQDSIQPLDDFITSELQNDPRIVRIEHSISDMIEGFTLLKDQSLALAQEGDFFCNLDGDDILAPDFMEIQLHALQSTHADIAACGVYGYVGDLDHVTEQRTVPFPLLIKRQDYTRKWSNFIPFCPTLWGKLFRSKLFTPHVFDQIPPYIDYGGGGNDTLMMYALLIPSNGFVITPGVGYYYTLSEKKGTGENISGKYRTGLESSALVIYHGMRRFLLSCTPTISQEEERVLFGSFQEFLRYSVFMLFHPDVSPPADKIKRFHALMTSSDVKELFEKFPHFAPAYGEVYDQLVEYLQTQAPSQTVLQQNDACKELSLWLYEIFCTLWQKHIPNYETFLSYAIFSNQLEDLKQGLPSSSLEDLLLEMQDFSH